MRNIGGNAPKGKDMDEQVVRKKLRAFITQELIRDDEYQLTDDEGIITGGLMDSFALAEFAVYVESEFGVYIPDSDLTVAKMDTLDQMVSRVTGR
jgi:acyl carrier protein